MPTANHASSAAPVAGAAIERLKAAVGPAGYLDQPSDTAPFAKSWRDDWQGRVPLVLRPKTTAEMAAVVRICAETGTRIVPQGGNTGLTGGSQPHDDMSEVIISTVRLNQVRDIDLMNDTITVEAGVVLQEIQRIAGEHNKAGPWRGSASSDCGLPRLEAGFTLRAMKPSSARLATCQPR